MSLSVRGAFGQLLTADATTFATRAERFFSALQLVPQGTLTPYQIAAVDSTDHHPHMLGSSEVFTVSVRLDHYGSTETQAQTLADAARAVLDSFKGIVEDSDNNAIDLKWVRITEEGFLPVRNERAQDIGLPRIRQNYSVAYAA